MKLLISTFLVFLLFVTASFAEPEKSVSAMVVLFQGTVAKILDSNEKLWTKLAKDQALSVVSQMSTDTANLETEKNDLAQLISTNGITKSDFLAKKQLIKVEIGVLKKDIIKFASEIDKAAPEIGGDLRIYVSKVETKKMIELDSIQFPDPNDKASVQKAVEDLGRAVSDLDLMRAALDCLAQTIKTGVRTCDPSKLPAAPKPDNQ